MALRALRLPLLLAALSVAALPALAGCIGAAQAASAKDNLAAADAAARAWDAGARLAQAVGAEGTLGALASTFAGGSTEGLGASGDDENVGDGLAEVWAYRYVAAGKRESYLVVINKEGDVVHQGPEALRAEDRALDAWTLDSDDAVRIALDANEGLRTGLQGRFFGFVTVLAQEGAGNPTWLVAGGGGDFTGGGGGHVVLDAVTGAVLRSEGGAGAR